MTELSYNVYMSWITSIIIGLVIYLFIYQLNKRLEKLEENRGFGYPRSFRVTFKQGIVQSKYFDNLTGQKKSVKDWKSWTEKENDAFDTFQKEFFGDFYSVLFSYLPSDNAWSVSYINKEGNWISYIRADEKIIFTESFTRGKRKGIIDDDVDLRVYSRIIEVDNKYIPVLTAYLTFYGEDLKNDDKYDHLFDFPYANGELTERLGFKADRHDGGYFGPNPDFALDFNPGSITYKKNNVSIDM